MWHRTSPFDDLFDVFRELDAASRRTSPDARRQADPPGTSWSFVPAIEWLNQDKSLVLRADAGVEPIRSRPAEGRQPAAARREAVAARVRSGSEDSTAKWWQFGRFERTFTCRRGSRPTR